MANDLVTTAGNAVATPGGYNPFLEAADEMGASSGAKFLKFSGNTGEYTYGSDDEELEYGTRLAVNPSEFKRGWICWDDGEVQDEIMVRVTEGKPPAKHELEDHGPYTNDNDGWSEQSSAAFRDVETGEEFLYKTSSKSGRMALANLVRDYGKAFQMNPGKLPVIELDATSFTPKKAPKSAGKKYAPTFKIVEWVSEAELIAKFADGDVPEDDEVDYEGDEDGDDGAEEEEVEKAKPKKAEPEPAPATGGRRARKF